MNYSLIILLIFIILFNSAQHRSEGFKLIENIKNRCKNKIDSMKDSFKGMIIEGYKKILTI